MPRQPGVLVVFPVITEVIAGEQGQPDRLVQASWPLAPTVRSRGAMGQVGAKHEQLQGTEEQGEDAEKQ